MRRKIIDTYYRQIGIMQNRISQQEKDRAKKDWRRMTRKYRFKIPSKTKQIYNTNISSNEIW